MLNWLNTLIIAAATSEDCSKDKDPSKCGEAYQWACGHNCSLATACMKSCKIARNTTCAQMIEDMNTACGHSTLCGGDKTGCKKDEAYAAACGKGTYVPDCDILSKCPASCAQHTGMDCKTIEKLTKGWCSGGPPPPPSTGCRRNYSIPDYTGYKAKFNPERDGVIEQDADNNITVMEARATPQWCKDTNVKPPKKGWSGEWKEYYRLVGLHKLACVGWTEENHHNATCNDPDCEVYKGSDAMKEVYSYDHFAQAVGYFPEFANLETMHQSRADIAAFFAHVAQETGGSLKDPTKNAMCWVNELGFVKNGGCNYGCIGDATSDTPKVCLDYVSKTPSKTLSDEHAPKEYIPTTSYPYWNSGYFGHGAFQLSYCYNHLFFSNWVEATLKLDNKTHPEFDFYWNPGFVATGNWAFASAIWFYMSASSGGLKPSMHSIVKFWADSSKDLVKDNNGRVADFGYQVNIINGGAECSSGADPKAVQRLNNFKEYFAQMGGDVKDLGAATNVKGCDAVMIRKFMLYWDIDGQECSGDSINQCADDKNCPAWMQTE